MSNPLFVRLFFFSLSGGGVYISAPMTKEDIMEVAARPLAKPGARGKSCEVLVLLVDEAGVPGADTQGVDDKILGV